MKDINSLTTFAKKYGIAYQSGNLYNGLSGIYNYGPIGYLLKKNTENEINKWFIKKNRNCYPFDSSIITSTNVLSASGHLSKFIDPLYICNKCKLYNYYY